MNTIQDDCAPGIAKRPCRELTTDLIKLAELLEQIYTTGHLTTQPTQPTAEVEVALAGE